MSLRTEIELALDDIISNEEGMRFQGIAVVLAKQKWPGFVACERKKDIGLDAYLPASLAQDGIGRGLASSLTATLKKITSDIDGFRDTYKDVSVLIFYTPRKVSNQESTKWAKEVYRTYKVDLITVSREDVITDLMLPANISICRSQLGLQVPLEPSITELVENAREAISEVIADWRSNPRLAGRPLIPLQAVKLENQNRETGETLDLPGLETALREGRRIVLEAPAGRGKTTTLILLAEQHLAHGELPFLIDLPNWSRSPINAIEFLARMPEFRSQGIREDDLAKIFNAVHCSFLVNGWNEVAGIHSDDAVHAIQDLERSFPKAGIIVATRSHHIKPPLPGSMQTKLLSLSRAQRKEYLERRVADRAVQLNKKLDEDRILDDLTRTPLLLSEVATLFLSNREIPRTKIGVLTAMLDLLEQSDEHRHHLSQPPLSGHSREYLAALAAYMSTDGSVTLEETQARAVVNSVNRKLIDRGQIAQAQEPQTLLGALCAHHVLERLEYSPVVFRFQHQQFQELLATVEIKRRLLAIGSRGDGEKERHFAAEYVNRPVWEESLRMIAEELGELSIGVTGSIDSILAGKLLVRIAVDIDPILSADLGRLCGARVWQEIQTMVGERLRNLYSSGSRVTRHWALAGMLASGSEDFKDILVPLLSDANQQARLETYRAWGEFHVSSLGDDWRLIVGNWGQEQRADFIREVVKERWLSHIAEDFAKSDPSLEVRAAALHALHWAGAEITLVGVLAAVDSQTFERALQEGILDPLPVSLRPRAVTTYQSLLQRTLDPVERLRIRLAAMKIEADNDSEDVKADLSEWPSGKVSDTDQWLLKSAVELLRKTDPHWVSHWLAGRIIEGSLWPDQWATMLLSIPETLRRTSYEKIGNQDLEYSEKSRIVSVLASTADTKLVSDVFGRMCQLKVEISQNPREQNKTRWATFRQLEDLYRAMSPDVAMSGLLTSLSPTFDQFQYIVTLELFGRIGHEGLEDNIPEHLRKQLRKYVVGGLSFTLSQEDYNGHLKMSLAMALGRVGEPEDTRVLYQLIQADIERVRQGRAARSKGERSPGAEGAVMSCTNWHVHALASLDSSQAEPILLELLNEPEYEGEAASALLRLATIVSPWKDFEIKRTDYRRVWEARTGKGLAGFDEDRRVRYASTIKDRIAGIVAERSKTDKPESYTGRVKGLSRTLALLDGRNSAEFILQNLALPNQWDEWTRVDALEALLFSGAVLPAEKVLEVLNPVIDHALTVPYNRDQADYLLTRCLCLLPFLDPSSVGIARLRKIDPMKRMWGHQFQGLMAALGYSRSNGALGFLIEMAKGEEKRLQGVTTEWIAAVKEIGTQEAIRVLLSFVDPDIEQHNFKLQFDYISQEKLASNVAEIARVDPSIKDRLLLLCTRTLPNDLRFLLADCVTRLGSREGVLAGLNLIQDDANPSIPPNLIRNLEQIFVARRPYEDSEYTYTLEPQSANDIRSRLFEMAMSDERRKQSAWSILMQIETWRLEYGRPISEPRHPNMESGIAWPPGDQPLPISRPRQA